jgi:hypothetical protein
MMDRTAQPIRSEDPWGKWGSPLHGGAVDRVDRSDFGRINAEARRAKTNRTSDSVCREQASADRRLGRSRLIRQPSSRNGENPPCGMIGGTMETAASFEVRNAPSSYPTGRRGEIPLRYSTDLSLQKRGGSAGPVAGRSRRATAASRPASSSPPPTSTGSERPTNGQVSSAS